MRPIPHRFHFIPSLLRLSIRTSLPYHHRFTTFHRLKSSVQSIHLSPPPRDSSPNSADRFPTLSFCRSESSRVYVVGSTCFWLLIVDWKRSWRRSIFISELEFRLVRTGFQAKEWETSGDTRTIRMALSHVNAKFQLSLLPSTSNAMELSLVNHAPFKKSEPRAYVSFSSSDNKFLKLPSLQDTRFRRFVLGANKTTKEVKSDDWKDEEEATDNDEQEQDDLMDDEERREWRKTIRDVINKYPNLGEEMDPEEKRMKMQKLLKDYPLVVEEEDPDWPEDADGRGFNLDQFFNKITIKNVKKDDDDDENYDSDKEVVWQDDDYIRPIKDITTTDWEETVFKDISPLIVLVHNRYKRPMENQRCRDELEKAVNIIWNCRLPSPRCVAIDAVIETDLVSALKVSVFPELIFTKSGKILYREKALRTADELSKIMAFFYYGAAKPPFFKYAGDSEEAIPYAPTHNQ